MTAVVISGVVFWEEIFLFEMFCVCVATVTRMY